LIIGLGNPGPEYADTRHNLGFRCVEELARRSGAGWRKHPRSQSMLAAADGLVLARPHTYMNRSGQAARALHEQLGVPYERVLVVYDDMDLPFGALRLRERGSPGTHNGMRSVVAELDSEDVPRLRIGISQAQPGTASDHVLSEFTPAEQAAVDELVRRAADAALAWAREGASAAMNRYNKS
jgi:peptidyl-tRNA hydrolase, PTH1 family